MRSIRRPPLSRRAFIAATGAAALAFTIPDTGSTAEAGAAGTPLEIWFVRHAESEINLPGAPRPLPDTGVTYPLTRRGVEQARALAELLANTPVTMIYTSTQLRAVQTADAIAFRHGLALDLAPEAVELNLGIEPTHADPRAAYLELARKWIIEKDIEARHGEGESFAEAQRRFLPFVREIMNRHAHDSGVIVIVGHSATFGLMVPVLAGNVPPAYALRHPLPHTGIIKTQLRDSRLFCTQWLGVASDDFDGDI